MGGGDGVLLIIQVSVSVWTGAWELERVQAINIYPLHSGQEGGGSRVRRPKCDIC